MTVRVVDWPYKEAVVGNYFVCASQNPYEARPVVAIKCVKCRHKKGHCPFIKGFTDDFLHTQPDGFGGKGGCYMRPGTFVYECKSNMVGMSFEQVCHLIVTRPDLDPAPTAVAPSPNK